MRSIIITRCSHLIFTYLLIGDITLLNFVLHLFRFTDSASLPMSLLHAAKCKAVRPAASYTLADGLSREVQRQLGNRPASPPHSRAPAALQPPVPGAREAHCRDCGRSGRHSSAYLSFTCSKGSRPSALLSTVAPGPL